MTQMIRYNGTDFERVEYRAFLDIPPPNHGIVSIAKSIASLMKEIEINKRDDKKDLIEIPHIETEENKVPPEQVVS